MKQKQIIIVAIVVVVILIGVGLGYFLFGRKSAPSTSTTSAGQEAQQQVLSLQPSDIGLTLSTIASGKFAGNGVDMQITKLNGIASVDYELAYTATGNIPRGAIGSITVKSGQSSIDQQLPFGTCSDVCHFDTGIAGVTVTLKVTKNDGKIYQVVASYNQ